MLKANSQQTQIELFVVFVLAFCIFGYFSFVVLFCFSLFMVKEWGRRKKASCYPPVMKLSSVFQLSFLVSSWWLAALIWLDNKIIGQIITKNEHHLREVISYPIRDISNFIVQFHKHMQLVNWNKSSPHLRMYEWVVPNPYSYIPKWVYFKRQQIYFGCTTKDWVHS